VKREIVITKDGSPSVYVEELREAFHSLNGSVQESLHTFVKEGLVHFYNEYRPEQMHLFEMGFGTGLNALLAWQFAEKTRTLIHYTGIEAFPLEEVIYRELQFDIADESAQEKLQKLHEVSWETWHELSDYFHFKKVEKGLNAYDFDREHNIVFFDAFAPSVQPELWSEEVFQKMYDGLSTPGALITYSAAGAPRRAMQKAGFWIAELRGAAGKREMTRAMKL